MRLYAMNYFTASAFEQLCDEGDDKPWHIGLDGYAAPQVHSLATDETLAQTVSAMKDDVLDELCEDFFEDNESWEELETRLSWEEDNWSEPPGGAGRPSKFLRLVETEPGGGTLVHALAIIHEMEG
jgi:hypothetical protein